MASKRAPIARRYETTVRRVTEVALHGDAEAEPWTALLGAEELTPTAKDGRVPVQVMACTSRFKGIRFRELSISVPVASQEGAPACFLLGAFNSVRFFAFVERRVFRTPYLHGDVRVQGSGPAGFGVDLRGERLLHAETHAERPGPSREDGWEGTIHLPRRLSGRQREPKLFYGRLWGPTWEWPFDAAADGFDLPGDDPEGAVRALRETDFLPRRWSLREDAVHARSKSHPRQSG